MFTLFQEIKHSITGMNRLPVRIFQCGLMFCGLMAAACAALLIAAQYSSAYYTLMRWYTDLRSCTADTFTVVLACTLITELILRCLNLNDTMKK